MQANQPYSTRAVVEAQIEALIALLDEMDGDPDLELTCEDEGAQCDDEGDISSDLPAPRDDWTVLTYVHGYEGARAIIDARLWAA